MSIPRSVLQVPMLVILMWMFVVAGCSLSVNSEKYSITVLSDVLTLAVPDSSRFNNIRVRMVGILGYSTASSFERITSQRSDTLIQLAVYAREVYDSERKYFDIPMSFDTTIVMSVPQPVPGRHFYFQLIGANQILQDSTFVY